MPPMTLAMVDLPLPFSPVTATNSPSEKDRLMLFRPITTEV